MIPTSQPRSHQKAPGSLRLALVNTPHNQPSNPKTNLLKIDNPYAHGCKSRVKGFHLKAYSGKYPNSPATSM